MSLVSWRMFLAVAAELTASWRTSFGSCFTAFESGPIEPQVASRQRQQGKESEKKDDVAY